MTKRALAVSLKNMLSKKPLGQITIKDITDDCGVSRMTFYYHFDDIYDLIEWICVEDAAKVLDGKKTYNTWQEGFLNVFQVVQDNRTFIMNVYRSVSREQVEIYLYKLVYDLVIGVIEEKSVGMTVQESDKQFIANFYKYAFVGILLDWIKNDMEENPQDIVNRISILTHGDIARALQNFCGDNLLSKHTE